MKLLAMHKQDPSYQPGTPIDPKMVQDMGALISEMAQKGAFLGGEGLKDFAPRGRVSVTRGDRRIEKAPYAGRNEVPSGLCLFRVPSLDDALTWAARLAESLGDGVEVEVGTVTEEWDLGAPEPSPLPNPRFLALAKADAKSEAGTPFLPRVAGPLEDMKKAGVFISAEGLTPSSQAKRIIQRKDRRKIIDGPFSESKELIGGFAIMQVASWDEALAWCDRYATIIGPDVEMDLRPVG
jgi:hypothetical protein